MENIWLLSGIWTPASTELVPLTGTVRPLLVLPKHVGVTVKAHMTSIRTANFHAMRPTVRRWTDSHLLGTYASHSPCLRDMYDGAISMGMANRAATSKRWGALLSRADRRLPKGRSHVSAARSERYRLPPKELYVSHNTRADARDIGDVENTGTFLRTTHLHIVHEETVSQHTDLVNAGLQGSSGMYVQYTDLSACGSYRKATRLGRKSDSSTGWVVNVMVQS